jgi:hypothetical protein
MSDSLTIQCKTQDGREVVFKVPAAFHRTLDRHCVPPTAPVLRCPFLQVKTSTRMEKVFQRFC